MKYQGSCHCKAVQYEVDMEIKQVMSCNCSICSKKGHLLAFAPMEQFKLLSGKDHLTEYLFNKKSIHHLFCKTCGIQSFAEGVKPGGERMAAINVRCLEGVDIDSLQITKIDGKHF
jgi:hypothetical protein